MASTMTVLQRVPVAPAMAAMFAVAAAIVVGSMPQPVFEHAVASSGLAGTLAIAKLPLGLKARLLAICLAAAVAALAALLVGMIVERAIGAPARPKRDHDDEFDLAPYAAPARPTAVRAPIYADRDLGAPLMSDEALARAAPVSADPEVVSEPEVTAEVLPEPIVELLVILPEETPTFEPQPEPQPEPIAAALDAPLTVEEFDVAPLQTFEPIEGETSIEALIRRLEAGLARRDMPRPPFPAAPMPATPPAVGAPPQGERVALRAVPSTPFDQAKSALQSLRRMTAR